MIALRRAKGLTQIELGEKINYSDKTISKWEKGDSCPNVEAVYRHAKFYDVSVDDLLSADFKNESAGNAARRQRRYSKLIISCLAVIAVWIIATVIFSVSLINATPAPWTVFVSAMPVSAVVVLVFNSMWGNTRYNYLIISILLWTLLASIFLGALEYARILWVIFLIGIPIQISIVLWSLLKKRPSSPRFKEEENEK